MAPLVVQQEAQPTCKDLLPISSKVHFLGIWPNLTNSTKHCKLKNSTERGLTVTAASVHGLLWPTCNHNHKLLASGSAEINVTFFCDKYDVQELSSS